MSAVVCGGVARYVKAEWFRGLASLLVLLLVGYVGCLKYLSNSQLGYLWIGGVVVGGIVHMLLAGEAEPEPFRFVLATIIWIGAATVSFGINHQAFGIAVTLLGGAGGLILLGSMRGLMAIGVAAAILIYRLFREHYPDDAKAPDIGQHYTMVGIALGALLPMLPLEWSRSRTLTGWRTFAAKAIWLLMLLGIPVASAVLLGSKGAIGMIIGLSFAAVIDGLRGAGSLASVGLAMGMGCVTVLSYGWLGEWTDLERAIKVRAVVVVSVVALVLAGALFGVSYNKAQDQEKS